MFRTTAASLLALATAILPAQAQTVLYGEQPTARPAFPQPQPYFVEPQQAPLATQPLYYETIPVPQPPAIQPPVVYEPEQGVRSFRVIPQQGVTPTQPFAPAERYQPPRPQSQDIFVEPAAPRQVQPRQTQPRQTQPMAAPVNPQARQTARTDTPEPAITESEALQDFSDELSRIVSLGERYRAASPGFLEDLRSLAAKYSDLPVRADSAEGSEPPARAELVGPPPPSDPPSAEEPPVDTLEATGDAEVAMSAESVPGPEPVGEPDPESAIVLAPDLEPEPEMAAEPQELPQALPPTSAAVVYLRDDFADGEYLSNPSWNVRQGQFTVDPAFGLRPFSPEAAEPAQVTPQALLQYLIGDGKPETPVPTGDSGASLIEAQTDIGNAFSLVTTITDHGGEGAAHFIMHQGGANWLGYRLELRAGPRPLVVLARRGSSGYKDIMKVEAPAFTSGKPHQLRWARLDDGQMFVLIDGRPIITARDTVFRQGWKGFAYFTAEADISMRNIRIAEPVER